MGGSVMVYSWILPLLNAKPVDISVVAAHALSN